MKSLMLEKIEKKKSYGFSSVILIKRKKKQLNKQKFKLFHLIIVERIIDKLSICETFESSHH